MRITHVCEVMIALAMLTSAACAEVPDSGIDLKELETTAPAAQPAQPAQPAPAVTVAPVAPLIVMPPPNPMPLQWVPNGAPKDSELLDSLPMGASFQVSGIANQGNAYVAILEYKGNSYIVQPGTMVPDQDDPAFQVRAISANRVEAFDPVMRRLVRRSLPPPSIR